MTHKDDLARKIITLIYSKNPDENITKEDFAILLKTKRFVVKRRNEVKKRNDDPEKKLFNKISWYIYYKFKFMSRITKREAISKIKAYYMVSDQILKRL